MVCYYLPNLLAGDHRALNGNLEPFPFVIAQQWSKIARTPVLLAIGVDLLDRIEIRCLTHLQCPFSHSQFATSKGPCAILKTKGIWRHAFVAARPWAHDAGLCHCWFCFC